MYSHALLYFCLHLFTFALMVTGAFSRNVGKLFSELKLVTDNLFFIYAEATERKKPGSLQLYHVASDRKLGGDRS